jgi:hypothetical protein
MIDFGMTARLSTKMRDPATCFRIASAMAERIAFWVQAKRTLVGPAIAHPRICRTQSSVNSRRAVW